MSESTSLSGQIEAFRNQWGRFVGEGVHLEPEAVEAFASLLLSFQLQARELERAGEPAAPSIDDCIAMVREDVEAINALVRRLAAARVRMSRPANVVPFRRNP